MKRVFAIPAINIQAPWAQKIIEGHKTIETRKYPIPSKHIGKAIGVIETPGKTYNFKSRVIGLVVFGQSFRYTSETEFYKDSDKHLIESNEFEFSWEKSFGTKWGWPILAVVPAINQSIFSSRKGIVWTNTVDVEVEFDVHGQRFPGGKSSELFDFRQLAAPATF